VVVGGDVAGQIELPAQRVGLGDGFGQYRRVVEVVLAHAQTVARLTGVDRIGAIGKGKAHGLERAGRSQQFGSLVHGVILFTRQAGRGGEPRGPSRTLTRVR